MNYNLVREDAYYIRSQGRKLLKGHWLLASITMWIYSILAQTVSIEINYFFGSRQFGISVADNLYDLLLGGPLLLGLTIFFLGLGRKKAVNPGTLFYGFEYYFKIVILTLLKTIIISLWTLLFIIPGIIAYYRYSMAEYIMADDPTKSPMECLRESKKMMIGNKGVLFATCFSFIGWILLASIGLFVITLIFANSYVDYLSSDESTAYGMHIGALLFPVVGIPIVVVYAYIRATITQFYRMVIGEVLIDEEETVENYRPTTDDNKGATVKEEVETPSENEKTEETKEEVVEVVSAEEVVNPPKDLEDKVEIVDATIVDEKDEE